MKKLIIAALLLTSTPAFAGGPVTGTIPYLSALCHNKGGVFTSERRRVGTKYVVMPNCDMGTIDENFLP
jgi:hypothetical protein